MKIDKENFEDLLEVMSMLNKIEEKQFIYDNMFEPLKEIVKLLKGYNYEFSDKVALQVIKFQNIIITVKVLLN